MEKTKKLKNFDKKKQGRRKEKGITLIALVITIIVLLILAAVSIAALTGENGILTKANKAKEETETASEEEQRELAQINATMHDELWYYKEGVGELAEKQEGAIPIPAGFAPTQIEGESTVEEGLVIIDSEGNEFVWIPCKYENSDEGDEVVYNQDTGNGDNREDGWKTKQTYYNGGTWYDAQPHNQGKTSVKNYGGFYVARYEAGIPENAPFYASKEGDAYYATFGKVNDDGTAPEKPEEGTEWIGKNTDKYIPVSKKGQQAWNYIDQINAKTVAENMVTSKSVKSYLIDSHAWNTVCRIMETKGGLQNTDLTESTQWGNYYDNTTTKYEKIKGLWAKHTYSSGWTCATNYEYGLIPKGTTALEGKDTNSNRLELATGLSDDFKVYNIYDMAGNMWEWTTETGTKPDLNDVNNTSTTCNDDEYQGTATNAVYRGGSFGNNGSGCPVVKAYGSITTTGYNIDIGFRIVLYLE